ncbi:pimelyl-ACP methyl ester esterase BioV [Sulfurimonas sp.]|uniref:pimelyl-ACP methyl ester esterase BioV n=1 Tax=Sulfurimonas sp. TaxID=2022749 RepID=UPI0026245A85|nr:pimelyl-ACP methyl ester esterase BioV [Sulfurimonas sp.]
MKFFSGFSLKNEEHFFQEFIKESDFTVCGFSYGAIKAYRYAKECISQGKRVDTLQLFSPAFFQTQGDKFKRLQMLSYSKERKKYIEQFIDACFSPYAKEELEFQKTTKEELEELLNFQWSFDELKFLIDNGVTVEVYLGGCDAIIDVDSAKDFFVKVATVSYIKDANHFLQL